MRPKKSLSQNFLVSETYAEKIVEAFAPRPEDHVLEIGPGRGALSRLAAGRVKRFVGLEIDARLAAALRDEGFDTLCADALEADFEKILTPRSASETKWRVLSNLPYHAGTAILRRLVEERRFFSDALLMLQREVAEKVLGRTRAARGPLSHAVRLHADAEFVMNVPPEAFSPAPKVFSSVLSLRFLESPRFEANDRAFLFSLIQAAFRERRKTLRNNLRGTFGETKKLDLAFVQSEISPKARAETLSLEDFVSLAKRLRAV